MRRQIAAAGISLGLLAGGAGTLALAGGAWAQDSTTTTTQSTTANTTQKDANRPDQSAMIKKDLQTLVDNGTITAEQLDAVVAQLKTAHETRDAEREARRAAEQETVASALGITVDELQTAQQSGKSIADLASEKGVDVNTIIQTLVDTATKEITTKGAEEGLDDAAIQERLANLEERITARVNGEAPQGGRGGHGGPGGGQPPADAPAAATSTTAASDN